MSSKLKWVAIAVVVLLVVLFIVPFLIPVNKFRPTIEEKASAALGRKVELGNLSLSILSGSLGVDNLSIADDPKFNNGPFLTAKSVNVGVELMPLIFSQQVNVTGIEIVNPQVTLLKNPSGKWNFSSLGASSRASSPTSGSSSSKTPESVSIKESGTEGWTDHVGEHELTETQRVPERRIDGARRCNEQQFSGGILDGVAGRRHDEDRRKSGTGGPEGHRTHAAGREINHQQPEPGLHGISGSLDGFGRIVDMTATLVSQGGVMATKGTMKLSKAVLVAGGQPAGVPLTLDFDTKYDLEKGTGVLNPSVAKIGNAKSNLSGTYKSAGDDFVVDLKAGRAGIAGDGPGSVSSRARD